MISASGGTDRRYIRLAALLVLLAGFLAYANAINDVFMGVDTIQNVRDNPDIRSLTPLLRAASLHRIGENAVQDDSTLVRRPVLSLSFALNHAALGPSARSYQIVNVTIHLLGALLLLGIVRRTLLRAGFPAVDAVLLAAIVASLWVAHPLTTESVSNIVQRAESLMGMFALLTLYGAIRMWDAADERDSNRTIRSWAAVAWISCVLGMGTKEIMVVVPVLVWLYDVVFVSRGWRESLHRNRQFHCSLAATWLVLVVLVAITSQNSARELDASRLGPYLLSQPRVVLHYLRLALWPDHLYHHILGPAFWPKPDEPWTTQLPWIGCIAFMIGAGSWALLRRKPAGFLAAVFFLPLLPTSLLATFTPIQEHRTYLSLIGVIAGVVLGAYTGLRRARPMRSLPHTALVLAALGALLACGIRTHLRNEDYESNARFWAPDDVVLAFRMMIGRSIYYGQYEDAASRIAELLASVKSDPQSPLAGERARAIGALGTVHGLAGRTEEGVRSLQDALLLAPDDGLVHNNLGVLLFLQGDRGAARRELELAVKSRPSSASAHFNLGLAALADSDRQTAAAHIRQANELLPPAARMDPAGLDALTKANLSGAKLGVTRGLPEESFTMELPLVLGFQ